MSWFRWLPMVLCLSVVSGAGCDTESLRMVVTPAVATMAVGTTQTFRAVVEGDSGSVEVPSVNWTSSDPAVLTIDATGVAEALAVGSVTVTAQTGDLSARATVEVFPANLSGERIVIELPEAFVNDAGAFRIPVDHAIPLQAKVVDSDGEPLPARDIEWVVKAKGSNARGAVNSEGMLQMRVYGDFELIAFSGDAREVVDGSAYLRLKSIVAGSFRGCGLSTGGKAWCWGYNEGGALGLIPPMNDYLAMVEPWPIVDERSFEVLALGDYHTCGIDADGEAWCWGGSYDIVPLEGYTVPHHGVAVKVAGPEGGLLPIMDAGRTLTCALSRARELYCWVGIENGGALVQTELPVEALSVGHGGDLVCTIQRGEDHAHAYCFGRNNYAQVTAPASGYEPEFWIRSTLYSPVSAVSAGLSHVCLAGYYVRAGGPVVSCWGQGTSGQTGNSSYATASSPTNLLQSQKVSAVAAGTGFSCALAEGEVYCWGMRGYGEIPSGIGMTGDDIYQVGSTPVKVDTPIRFRSISAGDSHICGLSDDDEPLAYCWGVQLFGALGDGDLAGISYQLSPLIVAGQ